MDLCDDGLYTNEEKLKFVIECLGISGVEIAKKFGVTEALVSQLRNYRAERLKPLHLYAFNSLYGVPLEIFENEVDTKDKVSKLLEKSLKQQNSIFQQDRKILNQLMENDGVWYFYSYQATI